MVKVYDIAVVGGGPAGLTAALYGLRNGKSVIVVEKSVFGGQIVNSPKVENIPGFDSISGDEFGDLLLNQVIKQGGEVTFDEVKKVESDKVHARLTLDMGEPIYSNTVILATGTTHRKLGLDNEESLIGHGVHFCAVCDGNFYKDKTVVLVGGGNSAFVEAELLVDIVGKLVILQDMPYYTAEQRLQDSVLAKPNIEKHVNTKVLEYITSNGNIVGVRYSEAGVENTIACDGVFLAIGLVPENGAFKNVALLDERGYFIADEYGTTATCNIFVAGDCRTKSLRQVATACSDGANAAIKACNFLKGR
ncbi:MAG: FAD-dependent oxidoreductase [Erysipelotrichaceae bacterium]|nr:FAD-dependent oxidoreductase [Erysipelotrichaceae bacterium]